LGDRPSDFFPAAGCWEIAAVANANRLVFVVWVAPAPAFDVVSIRENTSGETASRSQRQPGRIVITNVAVRPLILNMLGLQPEQLVGGPELDRLGALRHHRNGVGRSSAHASVSSGSTVSPRIGWGGGKGGRMRDDRTSVTLDRSDKGFPCMITSHAMPWR
jgi:hypothetical protein